MNPLYEFSGLVRDGNKRGRALGFPTANIPLTQEIPEGIYFATVLLDKKKYTALTFIGKAKTFNETVYQSETYILDFDEQIYGKELHVSLLKKSRGNEKFTTVEALVKQMEDDTMKARAYFKNNETK